MSGLVNGAQFKELINQLTYSPRGTRRTDSHLSSGLYRADGEKIVKVKLKLYIEDDGGTWESDNLLRPKLIWDTKKIHSGGFLIDSGYNMQHIHLKPENVSDTSDGLYFFGRSNSRIRSKSYFNLSNFNGNNSLFNIWINPSEQEKAVSNILSFCKGTTDPLISERTDTVFRIELLKSTPKLGLRIKWNQNEFIINNCINTKSISNIQILGNSQVTKVLINNKLGEQISLMNLGLLNFNSPIFVSIGDDYKGEISYISYNNEEVNIDYELQEKFYKFKYPLPRKKELVDMDDQFSHLIDGIVLDAGTVTKAIENLQGFFLRSNDIKVKNG